MRRALRPAEKRLEAEELTAPRLPSAARGIVRALTSPTAGVVLGVVLATLVYSNRDFGVAGLGYLADPPGSLEIAILVSIYGLAPDLMDPLTASADRLILTPVYLIWLALRIAAALAVCVPLACLCRWAFRHRSDPDSLFGTVLLSLPIGLGWWAVMFAFQLHGEVSPILAGRGASWTLPLMLPLPALIPVLLASMFQRFGSARPALPWSAERSAPTWHNKLDPPADGLIPMQRINLEHAIRAIEVDRTGMTVLGSVAVLVAALLLIVIWLVLILAIGGIGGGLLDAVPWGSLTLILAGSLIAPVLILLALALLKQRRPAWFRGLLIALLLGGLAYAAVEPFRLMAITATTAQAAMLKQHLLGLALWTLPFTFAVLIVWLHAAVRYRAASRSGARAPLRLMLADMAGLPRLVLGLGWRNIGPQFLALLALVLQGPARLLAIGAISTGVLASLISPLGNAKFQIAQASAACLGKRADFFDALQRIEACPGNREFDSMLALLPHGPPLFSSLIVVIIGVPAFIGLWLGRGAIAASARRYQAVASADPRPPILYLRPFHLDRVSLKWRPRLWSTVIVPRPAEPRSIDEIVLNGCIEDGPVVAYGRPGEPAPPLGAARLYVGTGNWKEMVYALAEASRYVVIAVEPTDGVVWEVEQTIANGWAEKTLYLLTSARDAAEAWRMVHAITGHHGTPENARQPLRPVAIVQRAGCWYVLEARDISRLAVEAAMQEFRGR